MLPVTATCATTGVDVYGTEEMSLQSLGWGSAMALSLPSVWWWK